MFIFYNYENVYTLDIICQTYIHREIKADVIQMLKKWQNNKINGKYWSSYVQWRNLLLLTP